MILSVQPVAVIGIIVVAALLLVFALVQKNSNQKTGRQQAERRYIDDVCANLKNARQSVRDPQLAAEITELTDFVGASPIRSNPEAEKLEQSAVNASRELFAAAAAGDEEEIRMRLEEVRRITAMRNNALRG